jgi:hypothetical protein
MPLKRPCWRAWNRPSWLVSGHPGVARKSNNYATAENGTVEGFSFALVLSFRETGDLLTCAGCSEGSAS